MTPGMLQVLLSLAVAVRAVAAVCDQDAYMQLANFLSTAHGGRVDVSFRKCCCSDHCTAMDVLQLRMSMKTWLLPLF